MIIRTRRIEDIKPAFLTYLAYMHQFFEIDNFEAWCNTAVKNLNAYSISDDHHLYTVNKDSTIIGFALVNRHLRFIENGFAVADFFIQPAQTRQGHGRRLARHIFSRLPGKWEVAVTSTNKKALKFWEPVVSEYTNGTFIKKNKASFTGYTF